MVLILFAWQCSNHSFRIFETAHRIIQSVECGSQDEQPQTPQESPVIACKRIFETRFRVSRDTSPWRQRLVGFVGLSGYAFILIYNNSILN
jgi:hypothetical protein